MHILAHTGPVSSSDRQSGSCPDLCTDNLAHLRAVGKSNSGADIRAYSRSNAGTNFRAHRRAHRCSDGVPYSTYSSADSSAHANTNIPHGQPNTHANAHTYAPTHARTRFYMARNTTCALAAKPTPQDHGLARAGRGTADWRRVYSGLRVVQLQALQANSKLV